jgi:hypothetical protein
MSNSSRRRPSVVASAPAASASANIPDTEYHQATRLISSKLSNHLASSSRKIYHETQRSELCAIHAINNLLGFKLFVHGSIRDHIEIRDSINLPKFTQIIKEYLREKFAEIIGYIDTSIPPSEGNFNSYKYYIIDKMINVLYEQGVYEIVYNSNRINLKTLLNPSNLRIINLPRESEITRREASWFEVFNMTQYLDTINITNSDVYYYILQTFLDKINYSDRSGNYEYLILYIFNLPEFNLELKLILAEFRNGTTYSPDNITPDSDELIGFIVKSPGHYVCFKRFDIDQYYLIDSQNTEIFRYTHKKIIEYINRLFTENKQYYEQSSRRRSYESNVRDTRANMVFSLSHKIHARTESSA